MSFQGGEPMVQRRCTGLLALFLQLRAAAQALPVVRHFDKNVTLCTRLADVIQRHAEKVHLGCAATVGLETPKHGAEWKQLLHETRCWAGT